eukprot:CAMPEP_0201920900 /NCGR_PEP_ID=MMETSP0903-20130614/9385_1 /ASSEMBLY_ACC=CAM_ASM_000552 /TAXON_ID=420261 /ORGANISM="Thalassiosira antarctica, Strain CCMP982" /LENGTH=32 /DNA_ID= /DNA_START= /DNA_END= /DNA_ORIENTATION=
MVRYSVSPLVSKKRTADADYDGANVVVESLQA